MVVIQKLYSLAMNLINPDTVFCLRETAPNRGSGARLIMELTHFGSILILYRAKRSVRRVSENP